jgi:hypothetical protein
VKPDVHCGLQACVCLGLMLAASTTLGADERPLVQSPALGLEFRAPPGWIVRHLTERDESAVTITRELLDGFPRYHAGFSARTVNAERRRRGLTPLTMARMLCKNARLRGIATTECLETHVGTLKRVEWQFIYPPDSSQPTVTMGWAVCLADEFGDSLVRLVLEAPEPEWVEVKGVAGELMTTVRRIRPGAETSADKRGQQ